MATSKTVLAVENEALRGVRIEAEGEEFVRAESESWPLVIASGESAENEQVVEAESPLAGAFRAAAKKFGVREFALSLPLSKMLVKTVRLPAEAHEDLLGAAQLELDAISPFLDEILTPGVEVVAETENETIVVVAALPIATAAEITSALDAAKVHVTTTDVTALGYLRALYPQLRELSNAARRLVLLNLEGEWDLMLLEHDAPVFLRGLGAVASADELAREVMLSLMQAGETAGLDEVVVCSRTPVAAETLKRLEAMGPVRELDLADVTAGAEGAARRAVEGNALDVTPESWREAREEHHYQRRTFTWLAVAGLLWCVAMGVLFGVDTCYNLMKDHQLQLQREKTHRQAFKEVSDMMNRVALIDRYADHAHGALQTLKTVTDCLPKSPEMVFRSFRYRRGENVHVDGSAGAREDLRKFTEGLEAVTLADNTEDRLFADVRQSGGETQTKKGIRFAIDCLFRGEVNADAQKGART